MDATPRRRLEDGMPVQEPPPPDPGPPTVILPPSHATAHRDTEVSPEFDPAARAAEDAAVRAVTERYEIVGELGRGGMGVAYHARDRQLRREVALKLLRAAETATPDAKARFRQEALVAASLQHPHIVQVYDCGDAAGCPYMVMQLAHGRDLDDLIRDGRVSARDAAEMGAQIAEALDYAHARGLLHRDIKPKNIKIERRGGPLNAMLLDFGLAKVHESQLQVAVDSQVQDAARLTRHGQILGTPVYMSPEQVQGAESVDGRSDLYSLGATLYESLCGQPPLVRPSLAELMEAILLDDPVPLRRLRPDVDVDLATICHKCLQKEPANRYASAADLAGDLRRYLAGEPILARPVNFAARAWRRARRTPLLSFLATALVLLLTGTSALFVSRTVLRSAELANSRAEARQAFARGDLTTALTHARRAQLLEPADAEIQQLLARIAAEEAFAFGDDTFAKYREQKTRVAALETEVRALRQTLRAARTHAEKRKLWEREEDLRRAVQEREAHFAGSLTAFTEALGTWKDHTEARRRLADLYLDRFLDAERARDAAGMDSHRALVLKFGRQEYARVLRGEREVQVVFRLPAGANVPVIAYLFRYESAGTPPVLVPVPVDATVEGGARRNPPEGTDPVTLAAALSASAEAPPSPAVLDARHGTTFPLAPEPACRVELGREEPGTDGRPRVSFRSSLPRGSYLLHIAPGQGLRPLRYPFEVRREEAWTEACDVPAVLEEPPLPPRAEAPPESLPGGERVWAYWRWVAAGPYDAAGDPEAQLAPAREAGLVRLPGPADSPGGVPGEGFFLARFEVTCAMYAEYLNDRGWHAPAAARARLPRAAGVGSDPSLPVWGIEAAGKAVCREPACRGDWPVWGVSWHDACDYGRWLTRRTGGDWVFTLPTEDEWEKAARGPDGRFFPWGDAFDPSFCRMQDSRSGETARPAPEPFGLFPVDESPYGVRDLAGGVSEWTLTEGGPAGEWRILKGSSWGGPQARCRVASREARTPEEVHGQPGFRLCAKRAR